MKKLALFVMSILGLFTSSGDSVRQVRNVVTGSNRTWKRGEVVYKFGSVLDNSEIQIIKDAMQEVMRDSSNCVRFLPREGVHSSDDDFVYFTPSPDSRCSASSVGKRGGQQVVLLGSDCMTRTGVMPLLLLTLGLYREHQRPDRDEYIDVHYTNIKIGLHDGYRMRSRECYSLEYVQRHFGHRPQHQRLFEKIDPASTDLLGLCYDYNSITHFGPYAYAVDLQKPTITSNFSNVSYGNKRAMSVSDVKKVQKLYRCGLDTSHIAGSHRQAKLIQLLHRQGLEISLDLSTTHSDVEIDCTFETPDCALVASIRSEELWSKSKSNSLVHGDHTRGAGHFMYSNSNETQLLTLRYIEKGLFCIQLAVFRSDSNTYLELHAELPDSSVTISNTTQCTDVGRWTEYEMSVNASTYWRLIIEARVGLGSSGIAVDDVSVTDGYCQESWCKSTPKTLM